MKLPVVSGRELAKLGFEHDHTTGSREIATGTLLAIMKQTGLTREELAALLK